MSASNILQDSLLPRLSRTQFEKGAKLDAPIYYFTPEDFTLNELLVANFVEIIGLLDLDLRGFYILGTRTIDYLQGAGYQLHHGWRFVLPYINNWLQAELMPTVGKLGWIPGYAAKGYNYASKYAVYAVCKIRLNFIAGAIVKNFIHPDRVWLVDWLIKHDRTTRLVFVLHDLISTSSGEYTPDPAYIEYGKYLSGAYYQSRSKLDSIEIGGCQKDDAYLAASMRYLFFDAIAAFPILNHTWALFNSSNVLVEAEKHGAKVWIDEIESGCLHRWHGLTRQLPNQ